MNATRTIVIGFLLLFLGCGDPKKFDVDPQKIDLPRIAEEFSQISKVRFTVRELREILSLSPIPEAPDDPTNAFDRNDFAATLGRLLFFDVGLSKNEKVSCATCHDPEKSFTDGRALMRGIGDGPRNTPTLWNVAHQRWFFWDGRADSLWAQAQQPLLAVHEMGATPRSVAQRIADDARLATAYRATFGTLPDAEDIANFPDDDPRATTIFVNASKAIAAFESKILTAPSPFDRFVAGLRKRRYVDESVFSNEARRGLSLFLGKGQCTLCHNGPLLSDREFHNIGLGPHPTQPIDVGRHKGVADVLADRMNGLGPFSDGTADPVNDRVRFVVQKPNNFGEFKTPTLRHVADTAPYMHDGRFATLDDVLDFYSELPDKAVLGHREESLRPLHLTIEEKADLIAFLRSLSGPPPANELGAPPK